MSQAADALVLAATSRKRRRAVAGRAGTQAAPKLASAVEPDDGALRAARVLPFLLLFSGVAALMYEVVWTRQFAVFLGASAISVTIVLATLMGGLGLGSLIFGPISDRLPARRLATLFAFCEVGVAGYALGLPALIEQVSNFYYLSVHPDEANLWLRGLLVALLLLPPCVLMGGTLPLASRVLPRGEQFVRVVSRLYAFNTSGAVIGTLLAGYVLLALLGNQGVVWVAICGSLTAAAGMWLWVAPKATVATTGQIAQAAAQTGGESLNGKLMLALYALSGAVAMVFEVGWVRALEMIVGTTTYAFTTMLAAFLIGIAAGSAIYKHLPAKISRINLFAALELLIFLGGMLSIWLMDRLPLVYFWLLTQMGSDWLVMHGLRFALAIATMLIPTVAMGVLFPVANDLAVSGLRQGRAVGDVYAVNAVGGALGAAAAGLLFIPAVGIQLTLMGAALISFAIGALVLLWMRGISLLSRLNRISAALLVAILAMITISPWEQRVLSGGMYLYYQNYERAAALNPAANIVAEAERLMKSFDLRFWAPGPAVTVAVMESPLGIRSMLINGKVDASAGATDMGGDMKTQTAIATLPSLLIDNHDDAYVVGLGSGATAGALLPFPYRRIRVAEISPAVIEAAGYFEKFNHGVIDSRRATIVAEDARHDLKASNGADARYDLIVTQPSNLWISGESGLYTREWYELLKSRLKAGGVVAQWLPAYNISPTNFAIVLNTLRQSFASVSLWRTGGRGDVLVMASMQPGWRPLAYERVRARLKKVPEHAALLQGLGLSLDPEDWLVLDAAGVDRWLAPFGADLALNTDDHLLTEFSTPRDMFEKRNVADFIDMRERH